MFVKDELGDPLLLIQGRAVCLRELLFIQVRGKSMKQAALERKIIDFLLNDSAEPF